MFDLYSCKVRLGGEVLNEVPKHDVTAPEIEVLRALHGSDAVVDIKKTGQTPRSNAQERERINTLYAASGLDEQVRKKQAMIRDLFGHDRLPLPTSLDDPEPEEKVEEEPVVSAPIRRTRAPKQEPAHLE